MIKENKIYAFKISKKSILNSKSWIRINSDELIQKIDHDLFINQCLNPSSDITIKLTKLLDLLRNDIIEEGEYDFGFGDDLNTYTIFINPSVETLLKLRNI